MLNKPRRTFQWRWSSRKESEVSILYYYMYLNYSHVNIFLALKSTKAPLLCGISHYSWFHLNSTSAPQHQPFYTIPNLKSTTAPRQQPITAAKEWGGILKLLPFDFSAAKLGLSSTALSTRREDDGWRTTLDVWDSSFFELQNYGRFHAVVN